MTIKELSKELNISEQALRAWCKKNNVRKERTQGTKATYVLDYDTILNARAYYLNESSESKATKEENQSKQSNENARYQNNNKLIDSLTEQLQIKDNQINKLTEQIGTLLQQIDKLTTALQAEQALHGMDKQQATIEVKAEPEESTQEPQSKTELPKQSFFKWLFGKKN